MMKKNKKSTQEMIGLENFSKYSLKTDKADFVFYKIEPTNVSVLSESNIDVKIYNLTTLLSIIPELEIIALDSAECFDANKAYIKRRLEQEQNEPVRKILQADYDFLDEIQVEMSTARQFMFAIRLRKCSADQIFHKSNDILKAITDHGFDATPMMKEDVKRMLMLYFGTSANGELISDIEGEEFFEEKGVRNDEVFEKVVQKKKEKAD